MLVEYHNSYHTVKIKEYSFICFGLVRLFSHYPSSLDSFVFIIQTECISSKRSNDKHFGTIVFYIHKQTIRQRMIQTRYIRHRGKDSRLNMRCALCIVMQPKKRMHRINRSYVSFSYTRTVWIECIEQPIQVQCVRNSLSICATCIYVS